MTKKLSLLAAAACSAIMLFSAPPVMAQAAESASLHLVIPRGDAASVSRPLVLPLNKAAIIDLPVDARDLLSSPDVADSVVRTARRVFLIGRKVGQTNAFFFDAQGRQIANLEIRVEPDVGPLNEMFARFAPNASVKAEAVNGSLVLTGTVKSAAEADRLYQLAVKFAQPATGTQSGGGAAASPGGSTTAPNSSSATSGAPQILNLIAVEGKEQVLVKVRIVEMSRTLIKQLGVNINANVALNALLPGDQLFNIATNNGFSVAGQAVGAATGGAIGGQPLASAAGSLIDSTGKTDAAIQAFERAGLVRVLAEPNLTAISGEAAKFLVGGEFPIPVAQDNNKISLEFHPFGVGLAFTPIVLSGGRISLKLATEVSELTSEGAIRTIGISVPGLSVRRAETTVEMPSGGALVMAGLLKTKTAQALEGIPGSKDLPILGALMRSRDFNNQETELVIIVTPYLVEATSPDKLKTPADGYVTASDTAGIFAGRLNAVYNGSADPIGRKLEGPQGHVVQ
jgi:pilus assembly protein CpaC